MNERIEALLEKLREAIHEALLDSSSVAQAMVELERERCCTKFFVDVALAEPLTAPSEDGGPTEAMVFTEYDEQFLRAIKVASPI